MRASDHLRMIAYTLKCIRQMEAEIIAQNEIVAALERSRRDARAARSIRAQLWARHEAAFAQVEQFLEENKKIRER